MEDEVCYTNVVFRESGKPRGNVEKGEETIYAEVKKNGEVISKPCSVAAAGEGKPTPYRLAAVGLGLLCALLLAALTALCVYYNVHGSQYNRILERYVNESAARQQLELENTEMVKEMTQLNLTLNSWSSITLNILEFDFFPVSQYCTIVGSVRQCRPCQEGWIQYHSSCYLFSEGLHGWWNWADSRSHCIKMGAHLVIIDNKEEQEFVNNHTSFYYDAYHGYWIGLSDSANSDTWLWVDGSKLNAGYWMTQPKKYRDCVLSMPGNKASESWLANDCLMFNKFICETKPLTWPDQLERK